MRHLLIAVLPLALLSCDRNPTIEIADPYQEIRSLSGADLKLALHQLVSTDHYPSRYAWEPIIAAEGGRDSVHLVYSEGRALTNEHGGDVGEWNREHLWPRSLGVGRSGPDSTDLHALMPCDVSANSSRGNLPFDDADGGGPARGAPECVKDGDSWQPPADERGDIARALFYMAVRYDGDEEHTTDLELGALPSKTSAGHLPTLLRWNVLDPPDDRERERNDRIQQIQGNRNPFVDLPELAAEVFGD